MTYDNTAVGGNQIQDATHGPTRPTEDYPPAPNPSADPGVVPQINAAQAISHGQTIPEADFDVASLDAMVALNILARGVQVLSDMTGDVPATPPISRSNSPRLFEPQPSHRRTGSRPTTPPSRVSSADMLAEKLRNMPIGSPEAHPSELESIDKRVDKKRELKAQYDTIARKFYSKESPPVSIHEYLLRLQRYCPMSTAVYLAAAAYIHKLAVEDKTVSVTVRTCHRLLLGALRVAMKALEDLNYPHARFAGVGGVGQRELVKLELAMCYLLDFNLRVDEKTLHEKARAFQQLGTANMKTSGVAFALDMPAHKMIARQTQPFATPVS